MNQSNYKFLISLSLITLIHSLLIINYIYIDGHISPILNKEFIPWYYYLVSNTFLISILILIIWFITNGKEYIKYSKLKSNAKLIKNEENKRTNIYLFILLEIISLIYFLNIKIFFLLDKIINVELLHKSFLSIMQGTIETYDSINYINYLIFLIPIIIFIKLKIPKKIYRYFIYISLLNIIIMMLISYFAEISIKKINTLDSHILNPFLSIVYSAKNKIFKETIPKLYFTKEQQKSIKLIDKELIFENNESIELYEKNKNYNILVIILESVGKDYVFKTRENTNDITAPMPFLYKLSKEGVWFENAYSNSGATADAIFGITTGMNTYFGETSIFSRSLRIPTINKFVKDMKIDFNMAANSHNWFPYGLFKNNEFKLFDLNTYKENYEIVNGISINEKDSINLFLNKFIKNVKQGKKTISFYLNNNTHFPYENYGVGKYKEDDDKKEMLNNQGKGKDYKKKYYQSLNYIDSLLEKMFIKLKKEKVLDKTIVIITGDHGQSFGQHNTWTHGEVFENIINIPLLIWQPNLIKNKTIKSYVSHVDIMPTILDLTNTKYNENNIQGISLLKKRKRKYIFLQQGSYMLLDTNKNIKMTLNSNFKNCKVYDLNSDKEELLEKKCKNHLNMLKIFYKYINYQSNILNDYNNKKIKEFNELPRNNE